MCMLVERCELKAITEATKTQSCNRVQLVYQKTKLRQGKLKRPVDHHFRIEKPRPISVNRKVGGEKTILKTTGSFFKILF